MSRPSLAALSRSCSTSSHSSRVTSRESMRSRISSALRSARIWSAREGVNPTLDCRTVAAAGRVPGDKRDRNCPLEPVGVRANGYPRCRCRKLIGATQSMIGGSEESHDQGGCWGSAGARLGCGAKTGCARVRGQNWAREVRAGCAICDRGCAVMERGWVRGFEGRDWVREGCAGCVTNRVRGVRDSASGCA